MRQIQPIARCAAACILGFALVAGAAGCASSDGTGTGTDGKTSSPTGSELPAASDPALEEGRTLVEAKCDMCHALDRIVDAEHDAAGWTSTVKRMRKNGAVLTDDEATSIVDYLSSL